MNVDFYTHPQQIAPSLSIPASYSHRIDTPSTLAQHSASKTIFDLIITLCLQPAKLPASLLYIVIGSTNCWCDSHRNASICGCGLMNSARRKERFVTICVNILCHMAAKSSASLHCDSKIATQ